MSVVNAAEAIEQFDLSAGPATHSANLYEVTDNDQAAYVAGGSLVSFLEGVSSTHKSDVLESTLLAQLAANAATTRDGSSREKDAITWFRKYTEVLGEIGWLCNFPAFSDYHTNSSSISADRAVQDVMRAAASGSIGVRTNSTVDALHALGEDSGPVRLWETSSADGSDANFQVLTGSTDRDGNVAMTVMCSILSTGSDTRGYLWREYPRSHASLKSSVANIVLNGAIYNGCRDLVRQKLGSRRDGCLANI